jgi:hypothetical protein
MMVFEKSNKVALEFLKNGQSFTVGALRLGMSSSDLITVTGWSQYLNLSNLTKGSLMKELAEIKDIFITMLAASDDLKRICCR